VFWKSGQTKVQGLVVDVVNGDFQLGWPRLSDSVVPLFTEEYRLPLLSPELAATLAAFGEHLFPILLLVGLATRFSALGLLAMTLTIGAGLARWLPRHWAAVLLFLVARGPTGFPWTTGSPNATSDPQYLAPV
jgi:putative oxidoreductase